jgi:hypothetical protein
MSRTVYFAVILGLATACKAQAMGGVADVAIIDRDSGAILSPHYYHGEYWVAGRPGARYSIEIRNRLGERVLAVASVDGVNVVSGATAAWDQTGYVFSPGEDYQITGWRKSDTEIAAFTFTESPNSYAERTGRPANVGVIGVALFRERPAVAQYVPPTIDYPTDKAEQSASRAANSAGAADARMLPAAPSQEPASKPSALNGLVGGNIAERLAAAPKLGTGHGEREYSYVNHTEFARMQNQPNEIIRIRYDSFDNLLAMGIVKRPRPSTSTTNPFPGSQYVPDPPG